MRRAPFRPQPNAQDTSGGRTETVVRRFAVDQVSDAFWRAAIGSTRTIAAALLAHDEQEPDARLAARAQPLCRDDLRRENAFRVARSPAKQEPALLPAWEERRHAVEVGGEHDLRRRIEVGEDVEAPVRHRMFDHLVALLAKEPRKPRARVAFNARRRVDVDEVSSQRDRVQRHGRFFVRLAERWTERTGHRRAAEPSSFRSCSTVMIRSRAAGLAGTSGRR